ncbi:MAG: HEAT repeat domain-containing protein [bacterium]
MPLIPEHWLLAAALWILVTQVGVVLALVGRNTWVQWRLQRLKARSDLLARVHDELGAETSPHVRAELARKTLLGDLATLEQWLDLVVRRGLDPARLPVAEYERSGLVDRYLRELLKARRWTKRAAAAEILGWTGSPRAVRALLQTALDVGGEAAPVRAAALRSLERIRHPEAVPPLVATLSSSETWFAPRAAAVLVRMGGDAVEPLLAELTDRTKPAHARRWAAWILGQIEDRRALRALHDALTGADPELRARAAKALGRIRDPDSVQPLLERLITDPSPFVRTAVAHSLGRLPTRETIEFLARSLSDPEWWVRLRAVESLGNLGRPASDTLRAALRDHDPGVAREAARALERIGAVSDALDALRTKGYEPEAAEFLIDVGRAGSLDALLDALLDSDERLMAQVVRILARTGNRAAGTALAELLLRTSDVSLQARVVEALLKIGARGHVREVATLLTSADEWVRRAALEYLESFADVRKLPPLNDLFLDPDPGVRRAALRLVERLRPDVDLEALALPRLDDSDDGVRAQAARTLASRGRCDLLLARHVAEASDAVVRETVAGLSVDASLDSFRLALSLFHRVTEQELERLADVVRHAASRNAREVTVILAVPTDSVSRWAAATVALVAPTPALLEGIEDLVQDDDPRVRAAALPALLYHGVDPERSRGLIARATIDRSPHVAATAVRALALEFSPVVATRLDAALRTADARVAVEVLFALAFRRGLTERHRAAAAAHADREPSLAVTAGRVFQGEADVLPEWLAALRDDASAQIIRRWHDSRHPLFSVMIARAPEWGAPLELRLLAAASAHEAEMELIHELDTNPDESVRLLCVRCLRPLESRKAEGVLLSTSLRDPSAQVRSAALGLLVGGEAHAHRLGLIEHALRDPDDTVQAAAARRTSILEAAEAVPLLVRHLETGKSRLFAAIVEELAKRASENLDHVVSAVMARPATERLMRGLVATLAGTSATLPRELADSLFDHRWAGVRAAALSGLARRLGADGAERVLRALRDPAATVRLAALRWCAGDALDFRAREAERAKAVADALRDPSPRVRLRAVRIVGGLANETARASLRGATRDRDARVARAAQRALATAAAPPTPREATT